MTTDPVADVIAACPFCGGKAEIERAGTHHQSCIIACTQCGGRHESGDEGDQCGTSWNTRAQPQPDAGSARIAEIEWVVTVVPLPEELRIEAALLTNTYKAGRLRKAADLIEKLSAFRKYHRAKHKSYKRRYVELKQMTCKCVENNGRANEAVKRAGAAEARNAGLVAVLREAEGSLADIGDADREPGDDLAWCERRAAEALPKIRAALREHAEG